MLQCWLRHSPTTYVHKYIALGTYCMHDKVRSSYTSSIFFYILLYDKKGKKVDKIVIVPRGEKMRLSPGLKSNGRNRGRKEKVHWCLLQYVPGIRWIWFDVTIMIVELGIKRGRDFTHIVCVLIVHLPNKDGRVDNFTFKGTSLHVEPYRCNKGTCRITFAKRR